MFYERLKKACTDKGTSPSALAREVGLSTANTGKWKHGGTPSVDVLVKFAKRLEVSADYLLGRTDDPTSESFYCHECGLRYNPHEPEENNIHDARHEKWRIAVDNFGFCWEMAYREKEKSAARNAIAEGNLNAKEQVAAHEQVFRALFSRSLEASDYSLLHVDFKEYCAMLLNQEQFIKNIVPPVYGTLVKKYGKKKGLEEGTTYYLVNDNLVALHNPNALALANVYQVLDEHGRRMVDLVVNEETARMKAAARTAEPDAEPVITFPRPEYELPVSAGDGVYLDGEDTFEVTLIDNLYTRAADFILRVSGDSMEPKFSDGDRLLVKSQPDVDYGEVGVWIIDSMGYVKKKGEDRLISINPDVDDVYVGEYNDYRCVGRVIGALDPDWIVE